MSVITTITVSADPGDRLTVGGIRKFLALCDSYNAEDSLPISLGCYSNSQRDPGPDTITATIPTEP